MNRQEYNSALESEIKKFLGLDEGTPIEFKGESMSGDRYVYSLGKKVGHISKSNYEEIKSKIK